MKKKSKRKNRNKRRFLMLIIVVLAIFIMVKINNNKDIINVNIDVSSIHNYSRNVINKENNNVKDEWDKVIREYLNRYTSSLHDLKSRDVTELFTNKNGIEAYLTQTTINTQVYHHSKQLNDMHLKNAYYDIEYIDVNVKGNKVTIRFIENDYYDFIYLNDITSRLIDIENKIVLNDENGKVTIDSIRIERDNYVIFTNILNENFTKKEIDELNNMYITYIDKEAKKNKELLDSANKKSYASSKTCDHDYDRNKAVSYSYKYVDDRNDYYLDYSNLGGNCANFASQSIHEGGIPMDYIGNDENEVKKGRSSSWVSTYYFYDYAKRNTGYGLCAEVDVNLFYAEIGDIIHVGYKDKTYSHTTIVSKIIKKDNKIVDILINSNTTGLKDYPIFGYIYQNKRLIKILGYND